jgi:sarcosine oxidase gamma subunit
MPRAVARALFGQIVPPGLAMVRALTTQLLADGPEQFFVFRPQEIRSAATEPLRFAEIRLRHQAHEVVHRFFVVRQNPRHEAL